jgi:hypothetical protein
VSRGLSAGAIALLASDTAHIQSLLYFGFSSPIYITDADFDIAYGGNTYSASSDILNIGDVKETSEIRVNTLRIDLSGISQAWIAIALGQDYIDVPVRYYRAILNPDYSIEDAVEMFSGTISGCNIDESGTKSVVRMECANHWADFQKVKGRLTNNASHQIYYPGDEFFEFASEGLKDLRWGR